MGSSKLGKPKKAKVGIKTRLQEAPPEQRKEMIAGLPHKVGFAKPPRSNQFKPGNSGNAKGRPKGARDLTLILGDELNRRVEITFDGRKRKVSMGQIIIRQLVTKAAKGDDKAAIFLVQNSRKTTASTASSPPEPIYTDSERDNFAVIADLIRDSESSANAEDADTNIGQEDDDDVAA